MPSVERDYPAAWRDYRRRDRLMLVYMPAAVPGAVLAGLLLSRRLGTEAAFLVAWVVMGAGAVAVSYGLVGWRCPRCGQRFHGTGYSNPFAKKCQSCGLPAREQSVGTGQDG
jgi:hypothetical protein